MGSTWTLSTFAVGLFQQHLLPQDQRRDARGFGLVQVKQGLVDGLVNMRISQEHMRRTALDRDAQEFDRSRSSLDCVAISTHAFFLRHVLSASVT